VVADCDVVQLGADRDVGDGAQQLATHVADHVPSATAAAASKVGDGGEWPCCETVALRLIELEGVAPNRSFLAGHLGEDGW
jgi:hypothetical protein